MADINFNFEFDDLDKFDKILDGILKKLQKIKTGDLVGQDEVLAAKKLTTEMLKVENSRKRQVIASQSLAAKEDKLNQKLKETKGIIGGLKADVRRLNSELDSATDTKDIKRLNSELRNTRKRLTDAKNTTAGWSKALGSFQFKFNALGNIASNVLQSMTRGAREFIKEAVRMTLETEGVRNAFNKINDRTLLDKLKQATRGTVNNLELMKTAVLAKNFKIPLEQLATFLEFAGDRALDTGEDFGFLVDSIVKGLGRKSVLILDNLGLSVIEINKEVKKTGDFMVAAANIIEREMLDSGTVLDTNLVTVKRLNAEFENLKLAFGEFVLQPDKHGVMQVLLEDISAIAEFLRSKTNVELKEAQRRVVAFLEPLKDEEPEKQIAAIDVKIKQVNKSLESEKARYKELDLQIKTTSKRKSRDKLDARDASLEGINALILEIGLYERERETIEESIEATEDKRATIEKLNKELKTLRENRDKASEAEVAQLNREIQLIEQKIQKLQSIGKAPKILEVKEIKDDLDDIEEALEDFADHADDIDKETEKSTDERRKRRLKRLKIDWDREFKLFNDNETKKQEALRDTFAAVLRFTGAASSLQTARTNKAIREAEEEAATKKVLAKGNLETTKRIESELEDEIIQIKKEGAKKQQAIDISTAIIAQSLAVAEIWKKWAANPGFAGVLTALAVGTVGLQIATIKAQQFAKGGLIDGKPHSQGGTIIEAERGEYVINRQSTSKYKDLIEGINENDQLKILSALDKDRMMPTVKADPYTKKLYDYFMTKEEYGETPSYFIINKGTLTTKLRK